MATVSLPELEGFVRGLAGERHDAYSSRSLGRAFEEFRTRRRRPLANVALAPDGREFSSFYAALADPAVRFDEGEVRLEDAAEVGPAWEYLVPFSRIVFRADGSADLVPPNGGTPRRAIVRVLLREHFLPRSREEEDRAAAGGVRPPLPRLVGTLAQGVALCRALPLVPFQVALLVYCAEERLRYGLDLVHSILLADPRAGRLALARRVGRTSRLSWGLDRKLGRGQLSLLASRCLEVLVESNGLTTLELAHLFGGVRERAESAAQSLVQQGYVTFDHRTGLYRPRLEAFLPPSGPAEEAPSSFRGDATLRASVRELQAAADARAACPLCGTPLPPMSDAILCDDCSAKVGLA